MTRGGSLDQPTTQSEFRAERLGIALRVLGAELVTERRKVAELRREVASLRSQLDSQTASASVNAMAASGRGGL